MKGIYVSLRWGRSVSPGRFSPKFLIGITNLECKSLRNSEPNPAHCIFFGRGSSVRMAIKGARFGLLPFDRSCGEDASGTRRIHRPVIHDPCIISVVPESDRHTWHAIEKEIHEHGTQSSMWVDSHWDQNYFERTSMSRNRWGGVCGPWSPTPGLWDTKLCLFSVFKPFLLSWWMWRWWLFKMVYEMWKRVLPRMCLTQTMWYMWGGLLQ